MIYKINKKLFLLLGKTNQEVIEYINKTFNLRFKIIGLVIYE
jgi:hypothetical protein